LVLLQRCQDRVERATKIKMSAYLQEKLFNPLGIDASKFSYTPLGVTNGDGDQLITAYTDFVIPALLKDTSN